ncbi:MAG: RdgB/HAM1 family non-canonical purine NTP pyrophosphatase [Anaerobiospirillum succiniciproducens]|uniref:RdgB/HAM1 family non-canonical purine NTP pyrophosphatase n=1 Tax=Anaerobiospirillum succiniciproducens TaxID=13335 RepID=UPI0004149055|nr:RdgB/HAM1 family non-canonical purine NTP pyrophosphatase [Anaerobiospirillum succiniciproducens]MDO4676301.1 RdgB/HAM1 family non-canonical purine NTP pyrophosphatase [Anaerobiospirillum succiniciproducens]MDY2797674.1 RdgB/HAM1 family non-canonical purine NTP pyrophosphatase [Anaerobiospirillum succiniciproducens]
MVTDIVLSSNNMGKAREFGEMLSPMGIVLHLQKEFKIPDADETGKSFVENALIKARHASAIAKMPALADDSGLCVDALGGAPGINSARFCGEHGNDKANNDKLLELMKDVPVEQRTARFYAALAFVMNADDPVPIVVGAAWEGSIGLKPMGQNGFGYDPLFVVTGRNGCTAAQIPPQIKHAISHRARAVALLLAEMRRNHYIK